MSMLHPVAQAKHGRDSSGWWGLRSTVRAWREEASAMVPTTMRVVIFLLLVSLKEVLPREEQEVPSVQRLGGWWGWRGMSRGRGRADTVALPLLSEAARCCMTGLRGIHFYLALSHAGVAASLPAGRPLASVASVRLTPEVSVSDSQSLQAPRCRPIPRSPRLVHCRACLSRRLIY